MQICTFKAKFLMYYLIAQLLENSNLLQFSTQEQIVPIKFHKISWKIKSITFLKFTIKNN